MIAENNIKVKGEITRIELYRVWNKYAQPYFKWQSCQFQKYIGQRVADVGCGVGNLTKYFLDREFYLGVDMEKLLLDEMELQYGNVPNVEIKCGNVFEHEFIETLRSRRVDSILCVNVLEHIEDDVKAIENMAEVLPKWGNLCFLVAAMPWLYGSLDTMDGHCRRYSKKDMIEKIQRTSLEIIKIYYFNIIGAFGWFLMGRVLKQKKQASSNYKIMNSLLPFVSRMEKIISPPFGQSLIVIARKK